MIIPLEPRRKPEIIFLVEELPAGGMRARAIDSPLVASGDTWEAVEASAQAAVERSFAEAERPTVRLMRLF
jgi:hypothetical protein